VGRYFLFTFGLSVSKFLYLLSLVEFDIVILSLGAKKEEDDRFADVLDVADENFMLKTDKIVSMFELGWEVLKAVRVAVRELRR
jgi:hypothetical protein